MFDLITSSIYWVLTALWLAILWFYLSQIKRGAISDKTVSLLLLILSIDAFRTLFESAYFGFFFNSLFGFLPASFHAFLSQPHVLIVPKLLNLAAALLILFLLIRNWLPRELRERQAWIDDLKNARTKAEIEKEEAERQAGKFEAVINAITDAIIVTDTDRRIISVNDAMQAVFGYSREDLFGQTTCVLYESEEEYQRQGRLRFNMSVHQQDGFYEASYRRKDGQLFVGETLGKPFSDVQGTVMGYIGVIRDVTERKRVEEHLQLSASVFTHAREGIIITDAAGVILDVNDTFAQITGYNREEAVGKDPAILKSGRHDADFYRELWSALQENGYWSGEIWNRRKSGEVYAELLTISAVSGESGTVSHYVALFTDITELKEHELQLEKIAHYDSVTGLPNRVLLADRLQQSILQTRRRSKSLAVAYLDLDDFKRVNDVHGHAVGDELLVELSRRMKAVLREEDTLARLGGDEFVAVILDMESADDCDPFLSRLLEAASAPVDLGNFSLQVSVSIGVTLFPLDSADPDQLVRHADQAMYLAKQMGKNRYQIFDIAQDERRKSRSEVVKNARQALGNNEFVLHYQPIVNMRRGTVLGVEALIRWRHPDRGLLRPGEFLPPMENHSIIVDLGDWVIDTALAQSAKWRAEGIDLPISVNVSARQLQSSDFVAKLTSALARFPSVKASDLELEILETSALRDLKEVSGIIQSCRDMGVTFALDDFGTGYSSLSYLKDLPANTLKIDQSFVMGMLHNEEARSIVSAVIGMASAFQRGVVAEGVESAEHGSKLLTMGCDAAQGYGIARPMPAADLAPWLQSWKPDSAWKIAAEEGTGKSASKSPSKSPSRSPSRSPSKSASEPSS